jgi:hypothetical protein
VSENQNALNGQIISEVNLLAELNIPKRVLDELRREAEFPYIRLTLRDRVYSVSEVVEWLKKRRMVA